MTKVERIWQALRNPAVENLELGDGDIGGVKVTFVLAAGEDEEDDEPVAILLDRKTLRALKEALDVEPEDDEDDPEDDEDADEEPERAAPRGKRFRP